MGEDSSVGRAVRLKSQAQYRRGFESPVRQRISLPESTSSADSLSAVSVRPPVCSLSVRCPYGPRVQTLSAVSVRPPCADSLSAVSVRPPCAVSQCGVRTAPVCRLSQCGVRTAPVCRLSQYGVRTAPVFNRMHRHLCARTNPKHCQPYHCLDTRKYCTH